jgi:hypothetical protein
MAAAVPIGGEATTWNLEDLSKVACGPPPPVVLDNRCLETLKKQSPAPKAFVPIDAPAQSQLLNGAKALSREQTRAAILVVLLRLLNGQSRARATVAQFLGELINRDVTPVLIYSAEDAEVLGQLADCIQGVGYACIGSKTVPIGEALDPGAAEVSSSHWCGRGSVYPPA